MSTLSIFFIILKHQLLKHSKTWFYWKLALYPASPRVLSLGALINAHRYQRPFGSMPRGIIAPCY